MILSSCGNYRLISQCTGDHTYYVVLSMVVLPLYYLAMLQFQTMAQARQSVVVVDGTWNVVASQSKFILALIASFVGECHPGVLLVCVQVRSMVYLLELLNLKQANQLTTSCGNAGCRALSACDDPLWKEFLKYLVNECYSTRWSANRGCKRILCGGCCL